MRRLQGTPLHVGFAEVDLKPPLGGSIPGYFNDRKATGFHDPILAKAIVLERAGVRGAIVALDLIGLNAREVAACRKAVAGSTDIAPDRVWIHATHTHTSAMVPRYFTRDADQIVPDIYVGNVDDRWVQEFPQRVAEAVRSALQVARATQAQLAQDRVENVAFYRRFTMKDGTVKTNPGRNNPEVVAPAGEPDPSLTVLRFADSRTLLVIFGVHPDVVGGTLYSADYPAYLTRKVQDHIGKDWGVVFLNAACGNINHIDVNNLQQKSGVEESKRIGDVLGEAVVKTLSAADPVAIDALAFASQVVPSRLRTVPEVVVKEAERLLREDPAKARAFNGLFAPAAVVLGRTKEREQPAEIAAMRLGPVGLAFLPGEIFVELAREIQHNSPFDPTRVIGLSNGALGYIPHAAAYEQGGYESGYRSARFEPQTGHRWVQTAVRLLKSIA
ncbi:MAG TPA: hypothetical protein VGZ22_27975 [Isosphaeraceae bacterium]|jgi:hypothetical protein|nr:hypothetical protein [Isosphaeraceae bacterium]